jgi:hypothetical protein
MNYIKGSKRKTSIRRIRIKIKNKNKLEANKKISIEWWNQKGKKTLTKKQKKSKK